MKTTILVRIRKLVHPAASRDLITMVFPLQLLELPSKKWRMHVHHSCLTLTASWHVHMLENWKINVTYLQAWCPYGLQFEHNRSKHLIHYQSRLETVSTYCPLQNFLNNIITSGLLFSMNNMLSFLVET
jgi:hypothetical protein